MNQNIKIGGYSIGKQKNCPYFAFVSIVVAFFVTFSSADLKTDFQTPPVQYKPRPFFEWNTITDPVIVDSILTNCKNRDDYGGMTVIPDYQLSPAYYTAGYFSVYRQYLQKLKDLGMMAIQYDDFGFPTGTLNNAAYDGKRLDMLAEDVTGTMAYSKAIPAGTLMGVVAMNNATKERTDITASVTGGSVRWNVPQGSYKIMIFTVTDNASTMVNYLDPVACQYYYSTKVDQYYQNMPTFYGSTIDRSFYDDISFEYCDYRLWTSDYNAKFQTAKGFSPILYYPALWFDIGSETVFARNALLGFRMDLYDNAFPKKANEWARSRGIISGGHFSQHFGEHSYFGPINDCMKFYKSAGYVVVDELFNLGQNWPKLKMATSAACNYDIPVAACETYGAFPKTMGVDVLYKEIFGQFARGINFIIPHAVWYDPNYQHFADADKSWRNPVLGPALPAYSKTVGRLCRLLQGGRHVADIGVLYPVAGMMGEYYFGSPESVFYWVNMFSLNEMLTNTISRDYTYIHPEILDSKCTVDGNTIKLANTVNYEQYKILIIPSTKTIHWSNLQKIKQFCDNGGKVIGIGTLPYRSAESGHDADVRSTIQAMFGIDPRQTDSFAAYRVRIEANGSTIKTFINGKQISVFTDATFSTGSAGFRQAQNEIAVVDSVVVTSLGTGGTLFSDDFSGNLSKWNPAIGTIAGGQLTIGPNQTILSASGSAWTNYAYEVTIENIPSTCAGLVFRAQDTNNYYMWQFTADNNLRIHKKSGGSWSVMQTINFTDSLNSLSMTNGNTSYMERLSVATLKNALDQALPVYDVDFQGDIPVYIHKVNENRDVYFFGNVSDNALTTTVKIRGKISPELWNPHTGSMSAAPCTYSNINGQDITSVNLTLGYLKSTCIVADQSTSVQKILQGKTDLLVKPVIKKTVAGGLRICLPCGIKNWEVVNLQGKILYKGSKETSIVIPAITRGVYILRFIGVNGQYAVKFIVQN